VLPAAEIIPTRARSGAAGRGFAAASLAGVLACAAACAPLPPGPPVREMRDVAPQQNTGQHESLFSHGWSWVDEKGESVTFARWAGQPLVVTAIFTQCKATCPRTVAKLLKVWDGYRAQGRNAQFLIVTLDPANDTPRVLQRFKTESGLPEPWHLLTGNVNETRDLRDLLGIHVIDDGPHLLHDGRILVFDEMGVPVHSYGGYSLDEEASL
jgi:cytochrome oxidase Cu insertion factor (SCO1/SenC/PrrC family)